MLEIFPLVVILPLLGFLHNAFLRNRIPNRLAGAIGTISVFLGFLITVGAFFEFSPWTRKDPHLVLVFPWIHVGGFQADFAYQIDQLSLYMTLIITGIGSLIHLYSMGYMKGDPGYNRFFAYLNLFVFSMLNLVLSDNLVLTFLGWEGVGLCSYLLIGFEYEKDSAAKAGMKAFVVNRIGDLGFVAGTALLFWFAGTVRYSELQVTILGMPEFATYANVVALAFFIAAMGKSAQVPLYVWLPDAMAGPTPVSALIHAATMVTAGVFLIARLAIVFTLAPETSLFIASIGAFTALFSATIGGLQNDIKKVLAYSTVSQLGFMFLAMGTGAYVAGLFHLMTHAFFKALLFLGAGSVIHALHHEQDIRKMGGLAKKIPITFVTFLLGTLAISGIPPFSGFFSKDLILEKAFAYPLYSEILWGMSVLAAGFTAFYMFRLTFLVFTGGSRFADHGHPVHESPLTMTLPLILLATGAVFAGFLQTPHFFLGIHTLESYFEPVLAPSITNSIALGLHRTSNSLTETQEVFLAGLSVLVATFGILISFFLHRIRNVKFKEQYEGLSKIVYNKYYIDELYDSVFVKPFLGVSRAIAFYIDTQVVDRFFLLIGFTLGRVGAVSQRLQTGFVGDYALYIVLGSFVIVIFLLAKGV